MSKPPIRRALSEDRVTDDRPPHEKLAEQILTELEAAHTGKYPSMEVGPDTPDEDIDRFLFGDELTYEDMTDEQKRIVDAGDEIAGTFPTNRRPRRSPPAQSWPRRLHSHSHGRFIVCQALQRDIRPSRSQHIHSLIPQRPDASLVSRLAGDGDGGCRYLRASARPW